MIALRTFPPGPVDCTSVETPAAARAFAVEKSPPAAMIRDVCSIV